MRSHLPLQMTALNRCAYLPQVMEFVNSIARIVHMEVSLHGGSANKVGHPCDGAIKRVAIDRDSLRSAALDWMHEFACRAQTASCSCSLLCGDCVREPAGAP